MYLMDWLRILICYQRAETLKTFYYLKYSFPRHPADGQHSSSRACRLHRAVVCGVDVATGAEVSDLDLVKVTDEAVASG